MLPTHQKLSRKIGHRRLLVKNMLTSLFLYEKITSTKAKIKAIKPITEKLLSRIKNSDNNVNLIRYLKKYLIGKNVIDKLIEVYQPNLKNNDKFVFKYNLNTRKGDGAELAMLKINPDLVKLAEVKEEKEMSEKSSKKILKKTKNNK
ncbi:MAG: 50S ribosomal protein L17 [Berkelbacteria bacterium GW2011_GWA2_35_9]|uniref:50S ribosomal protein L17 n=1 Tax=Berkelbacteria bacterium GW2011_GWA2_35_9 TaxID=1618333 RepID=A0A0G0DKA1_9BACT|nr:MAG: 50S ribosomal protein L17 [Berkelbacteria bacterium GW2011_GWA2_35_9]